MHRRLFSLLPVLLICTFSSAQIDFRIGPEVGYLQTRFRETYSDFDGQTYRQGSVQQTIGCIARFEGRCLWREHWQVSSGLTFQMAQELGHRSSQTFAVTDSSAGDYELRTTFQKIALPVLVGYSIPAGPLRFSINTGFRLGFMVRGNSRIDGQTVHTNAPTEYTNADFDHFDNYFKGRWTMQWMAAIGVEFKQQWCLGIQLAKGEDYSIDATDQFPYRHRNFDGFVTIGWHPFHIHSDSKEKPHP